jgi:hypothetical protein
MRRGDPMRARIGCLYAPGSDAYTRPDRIRSLSITLLRLSVVSSNRVGIGDRYLMGDRYLIGRPSLPAASPSALVENSPPPVGRLWPLAQGPRSISPRNDFTDEERGL